MNLAIKKSTTTDLWPIFEEEEAPYKIANSGRSGRQSCCGLLWKESLIATMNFTGKYQLQSQENFEPFMKAMGECWMGHQSCEGLALLSATSQGLMLRWKEGSRLS